MRETIAVTLALIAVPLLLGAHIIGIGALLYYWGALSLPLGAAAWIAFKVWIFSIGTGLFALLFGALLSE